MRLQGPSAGGASLPHGPRDTLGASRMEMRQVKDELVRARRLTSIALAVLIAPQAALSRDADLCANLYQRLNSTPQIIGTGGDARRYAKEVSSLNADIRRLRIDMRRQGCGNGSIVTFGRSDGNESVCAGMEHALEAMETERESLTRERNNSRSMLQPSEERVALLAAIRSNGCTPTDLDVQTEIDERERVRIRGLALPQPDGGNSSITRLGGSSPAKPAIPEKIEFPPDRPYDPDRKVRMVGPQFFPEPNLDLAHPKSAGPQPLQE